MQYSSTCLKARSSRDGAPAALAAPSKQTTNKYRVLTRCWPGNDATIEPALDVAVRNSSTLSVE
jgi:hypothetical protein